MDANMFAFAIFSFLIVYGSCEVEVLGNAKNVILVIAQGISSASVTSARIQEGIQWGNSSHLLSFETFPHHGVLKAYDSNFKPGNQAYGQFPLFYGAYNQLGNVHDENRTLFMSAQNSKKSIGLVTTIELENLPSTFNRIGLSKYPESNKHNCSDASCCILHGCFGIDIDIIIGKRSGPIKLQDPGCDCFNNYEHNKTKQSVETPKIMYVNSTEEFERIEPKEKIKLFGLFSENDLMGNHPGGKLNMLNLTNVIEKSIKILSKNPNGFFMVVMVTYNDMVKNVKIVSELSDSIQRATSIKDTLLVVTSDITFTERCKHGIENGVLKKGDNTTAKYIATKTNLDKSSYNVSSSSILRIPTTSSNASHANVKINCTEYSAKDYMDVPVYAYGPYPVKMPAVQDQASFGLKIMKILEEKHYEDITFNSGIGEINSDMFQKDIKAAMAEIDEMTNELFNDWL